MKNQFAVALAVFAGWFTCVCSVFIKHESWVLPMLALSTIGVIAIVVDFIKELGEHVD